MTCLIGFCVSFLGDNKTLSAGRDPSGKLLMAVAKSLGWKWEQAALHLLRLCREPVAIVTGGMELHSDAKGTTAI